MRGNPDEEVVVRLDPCDVVRLQSALEYDPQLSRYGILFGKFFVDVPRRIEVRNGDSWEPYPSVTSFRRGRHRTRFVFLRSSDNQVCEEQSTGKIDNTLEKAARRAGIDIFKI